MDLHTYHNLVNYLEQHELPKDFNEQQKRQLSRMAIHYSTNNGILYKKNRKNPEQHQRVITLLDREKLLYNLHSSPFGGHFGVKKTIERILEKYYWPNLGQDVKRYIETCDACQRTGKPPKVQLTESTKVVEPFYQIGIDFIGPLKETTNGNKYIIVATDYFTKWPEAKAVPKATAAETAEFLYKDIICRHGAPSVILTDRGSHFVNNIIKEIQQEVGFTHKLASAYHPQTNGQTERFNGTLCRSILKTLQTSTAEWDTLIPSILLAYRSLKHESTKFSPFFLVYGREPQLPVDLEINKDKIPMLPYEEALQRRISSIVGVFKDTQVIAQQNIMQAQQRQREQQNKLKKPKTFKINDMVLMYDSSKQHVFGDKFSVKWLGPYWIEKKLGTNTYLLRDQLGNVDSRPVHAERLKFYKQRETEEPTVIITGVIPI
jgi:hypothetical protein